VGPRQAGPRWARLGQAGPLLVNVIASCHSVARCLCCVLGPLNRAYKSNLRHNGHTKVGNPHAVGSCFALTSAPTYVSYLNNHKLNLT